MHIVYTMYNNFSDASRDVMAEYKQWMKLQFEVKTKTRNNKPPSTPNLTIKSQLQKKHSSEVKESGDDNIKFNIQKCKNLVQNFKLRLSFFKKFNCVWTQNLICWKMLKFKIFNFFRNLRLSPKDSERIARVSGMSISIPQ